MASIQRRAFRLVQTFDNCENRLVHEHDVIVRVVRAELADTKIVIGSQILD
jgi:hypothetical protein